MTRRERVSAACLLVLSLVVLPMSTAFGQSEGSLFEGPVPRADCGPGSRLETGLQGQVPLADRDSGRSAQGYSCNLGVVGRYGPADGFEGAEWQMAWYGHCAYYDTRLSGRQERRGTIVVDVSDPAHPRYSTNLTTAAMQNPWESLKVNQKRGLLAGVFAGDAEGAAFFDVYDVKTDCAHPRLLASVPVNGLAHEGDWAPDGRTYYATGVFYSSLVTAIDVTDPDQPRPITAFAAPPDIHGLGVSADGRRLYLAHVNPDWQTIFVDGRPNATAGNGLGIHDISQIQDRSPNPQARLLAATALLPPAGSAAPSPASPRPSRESSPSEARSGSPTRTAASTLSASPTAPGRSLLHNLAALHLGRPQARPELGGNHSKPARKSTTELPSADNGQ
jgi:hypothetical protein